MIMRHGTVLAQTQEMMNVFLVTMCEKPVAIIIANVSCHFFFRLVFHLLIGICSL